MRGTICILIVLLLLPALRAQDSLAVLEQAAVNAQAEWFRLASDLDVRLARMLPCAPTVASAIDETHRASTARLAALSAYTRAAATQAAEDVKLARAIQSAAGEAQSGASAERADTEQERAGAESQLTNLADSLRRRVALSAANDQLRALEALVRDRARMVADHYTSLETERIHFSNLVIALENREEALRKQAAALEEERAKWNGFYAARLARARVECSVTGTGR